MYTRNSPNGFAGAGEGIWCLEDGKRLAEARAGAGEVFGVGVGVESGDADGNDVGEKGKQGLRLSTKNSLI